MVTRMVHSRIQKSPRNHNCHCQGETEKPKLKRQKEEGASVIAKAPTEKTEQPKCKLQNGGRGFVIVKAQTEKPKHKMQKGGGSSLSKPFQFGFFSFSVWALTMTKQPPPPRILQNQNTKQGGGVFQLFSLGFDYDETPPPFFGGFCH